MASGSSTLFKDIGRVGTFPDASLALTKRDAANEKLRPKSATYLLLHFKRQSDVPAKEELRSLPLRIQHRQVRHDLRPDPQMLQRLVVRLQLQV